MDNYQFNLLTFNDQAGYTWEHGTYLATRLEGVNSINLYHVDKFFVEVWNNVGLIEIEKIRSFKSNMCLEPYLASFKLKIKTIQS